MNHIRFISTNKSVCESPKTLGYDFVVVDYSGAETCKMCLSLLYIHNEKMARYDMMVTLPSEHKSLLEKEGDPVLGFLLGAAGATGFWLGAFVLWLTFFN